LYHHKTDALAGGKFEAAGGAIYIIIFYKTMTAGCPAQDAFDGLA
jgi:hypothetical protein